MKKNFFVFGVLAAFALTATVAMADPGPYPVGTPMDTDSCDNGSGLVGVSTQCTTLGEINVVDTLNYLLANSGSATTFASNSHLDPIQLTIPHSHWADSSAGQAVLLAISVSAGGINTPFIYEYGFPGAPIYMAGATTGDVFFGDGTNANPYPGVLNPFGLNSFGIGIEHQGDGAGAKYSDPTLNPGGFDNMLAFDVRSLLDGSSVWLDLNNDGTGDLLIDLQDTYMLAFEDRPMDATNQDFNDTIFLLTHVKPSTVPEPMTMALFGTGLLGMAVRRNKKA